MKNWDKNGIFINYLQKIGTKKHLRFFSQMETS
nr:MAG TPA: hypothetical protein [Caudoviricetes sp.]